MKLLPLDLIGAHEDAPGVIDFGLYLPNVIAASNVALSLKIIHENDQFIQNVQPLVFDLANTANAAFPNGDYWTVTVDTNVGPPQPLPATAHWGHQGTYVYRYIATAAGGTPIDFIIDPYAREYGVGDLSAITVGFRDHVWSAGEANWNTPNLKDMIFYELMINEFGFDIEQTIPLLDYLKDLGVNCLEVMPVNNVKNTINWGYDPIGYFGVDERFGNRANFQAFVDAAHQRGLAVVLDSVYGHTTSDFIFPSLYPKLGIANPFNGPKINDIGFGPMPDFSQEFVQDYFFTVNQIWLDKYHIDGFRYDNVPAFWDKANPGLGYGALVAQTYQLVAANAAAAGGAATNYWRRFQNAGGGLNLIQCAEYLPDPPAVLNNTMSNCTWQDWTLSAAKDCAHDVGGAISDLGNRLGLEYFPVSNTFGAVTLQQTALQYIENHDHSRFLCELQTIENGDPLLWTGNRDLWQMLRPYLIGLLTAKGVPMLWEGQEFGQNYYVPDNGGGRPYMFRPVDWAKFYDPIGKSLIGLVRKLIAIRNGGAQFRSDNHFFFDTPYYNNAGLLVFKRWTDVAFSLVALNFTANDVATSITLPSAGNYIEQIDGNQNQVTAAANQAVNVTIPGNYGQIWTKQ